MNAREAMHQAKLVEWKERVGICRSSGLPVRRWCEEQGIKVKTYYYWEQQVLYAASRQGDLQSSRPQFAELPAPRGVSPGTPIMTIRMGGMAVDIYHGADAGTVAALCQVLKQC